jgi:hypothetical protein
MPLEDRRRTEGAAGVLMVPIPGPGILVAVEGQDQARAMAGVTGLDITVAPGRFVAPPPDGDRYLGFVFARGAHPAAVEHALREAGARLQVHLDTSGAASGASAACS